MGVVVEMPITERPRTAPYGRIVAASIGTEEGAKTKKRRGSIRQGIQGLGGGKTVAAGERSMSR